MPPLPTISNEGELDELLSRPTAGTRRALADMQGDLLVLGVGGKMGADLLRLARRSADEAGRRDLRIIGVARFSLPGRRQELERAGIETLPMDLLDESARRRLHPAGNVLLMLGFKFGADAGPGQYWAMNAYLPGLLAEQFRGSRLVAFSSGNVYPFTPAAAPAPVEETPCAPVGEYAVTAWGRERMLEYVSWRHGTPVCLLRLNYAVDLRYGVVVDIGQKVLAGEPIDLSVPEVNFCWQGYANAVALQAFRQAASPAAILNVTGTGRHRVRDIAARFGAIFGVEPRFADAEGPSSLVSDASRCHALFGPPQVTDEQVIDLAAAWLRGGGRTLGKATKFQVRDGRF
jgi:nucleoside-diphosphate-sugar epimerase